MIPRWSFVSGNISLSLNFTSVICCSPKSSWFKNSISKSLLYSWPKILLNDQSENGLMYLAISGRFYVLAAKIRFSFVTSKKLTKKVFVGGRGEGERNKKVQRPMGALHFNMIIYLILPMFLSSNVSLVIVKSPAAVFLKPGSWLIPVVSNALPVPPSGFCCKVAAS